MKSKIYTKTGDKGQTSLVNGERLNKDAPQIDLYGDVDELNSFIGLFHAELNHSQYMEKEQLAPLIHKIQSALFDLGGNLACPPELRKKYKLPQIEESLIKEMEKEIDRMDEELTPLKNFILPGGSLPGANLHICRTVCRRVERKLVSLTHDEPALPPENALSFLNRLSDYLFVLSRHVNIRLNEAEIPWVPAN